MASVRDDANFINECTYGLQLKNIHRETPGPSQSFADFGECPVPRYACNTVLMAVLRSLRLSLRVLVIGTFLRMSCDWSWGVQLAVLQALAAAAKPFVTTDYMLPTPKWAVYGADEAGFDPQEIRFKKVRNHPKVSAVPQK